MTRSVCFLFCIALLATLLTGCSNKASISGKVTFSNGEPLPKGKVVFQSSAFVADGKIAANGSYTVSEIPPGSYMVYLSGAGDVPAGFVPPPDSDDSGYESFVDNAYSDPDSTPIKCEVTKSQTFDFKVKPSAYYAKEKNIPVE